MKIRGLCVLLVSLFFPATVFAACSNTGYTVVYVNGILTSEADALRDLEALESKLPSTFNNQTLIAYSGYNPSHLDGRGDAFESVSQTFGVPISNYDLDTILDQIAPEVTTQKVLLVGHSQGTFYTNEMYDYLVKNGIPPQSIAVYNIATPASYVAGNGMYLTSASDKAINYIRQIDAEANASAPLSANILIPLPPSETSDSWGGHHLQSDYLAGAAPKIVSDIEKTLNALTENAGKNSSSCFSPPAQSLSYDAQKDFFALADPVATHVDAVNSKISTDLAAAGSAIAAGKDALTNTVNSAVSTAFFSVFPKPDAQNAGTTFAIEKALYGSSLSEEDYEDLLAGDDISDQSAPPSTPVPSPQSVTKAIQQTQPASETPQKIQESVAPQSVISDSNPAPAAPSSISPGFGGGGSVAIAAVPQTPDPDPVGETLASSTDATDTDSTSTAQTLSDSGNEDATSTPPTDSATSTPPEVAATSTPPEDTPPNETATTTPEATSTPPVSTTDFVPSCPTQSIAADGYFFSSTLDDTQYSSDGLLEYRFALKPDFADGRTFTLSWSYFDDDCNPISRLTPSRLLITLPTGVTDWSVRFSSATHFDVWDDQNEAIVASSDIATLSSYASIKFTGTIDGGASTFSSRIVKIDQTAAPPLSTAALVTPEGCSAIDASGYYFDSYEHAEYVDGLLQVHLRTLAPFEDDRQFRSAIITPAADCTFVTPSFRPGSFSETMLASAFATIPSA